MPAPSPIQFSQSSRTLAALASALGRAEGADLRRQRADEVRAQQMAQDEARRERDAALLRQSLQNQQQRRLASMQVSLERAKEMQRQRLQKSPQRPGAQVITREMLLGGQPEQPEQPQLGPRVFGTAAQQPSGYVSGPAGRLDVGQPQPARPGGFVQGQSPQTPPPISPNTRAKAQYAQNIASAMGMDPAEFLAQWAPLIQSEDIDLSQMRLAMEQQREIEQPAVADRDAVRALRDQERSIEQQMDRIEDQLTDAGYSPFRGVGQFQPLPTEESPGVLGTVGNVLSYGQPFNRVVTSQRDVASERLWRQYRELQQKLERVRRQRTGEIAPTSPAGLPDETTANEDPLGIL